jgi:hypothetical protein
MFCGAGIFEVRNSRANLHKTVNKKQTAPPNQRSICRIAETFNKSTLVARNGNYGLKGVVYFNNKLILLKKLQQVNTDLLKFSVPTRTYGGKRIKNSSIYEL